jgi:GNAT superfamily N-acetyltransferase
MSIVYQVSCDKSRLDIDLIYQFLTQCYWSKGIHKLTITRAIEHSLCFGVYKKIDGSLKNQHYQQVGFARVISDYATFGYLADVFILPEYRQQGLSKMLMGFISKHPDLQGLRRMLLATADAHNLYRQFDYKSLQHPETFMENWQPNIYQAIKHD